MDMRVGLQGSRTLQSGSGQGEGGTSHFGGAELLGQSIILPSHVLGELCCFICRRVGQHGFCGQTALRLAVNDKLSHYC